MAGIVHTYIISFVMIYLIIAILFSSTLSIFMRISEKYIKGNVAMLVVNYITCTLVAAYDSRLAGIVTDDSGLGVAMGIGVIGGIAFFTTFLLLQYNIKKNGVVMPATFMKLGLLVPTVASVVVFHEQPKVLQIVGFAIALAAIILINSGNKSEKSQQFNFGLLILLMLLAGVGDITSKLHEELGNPVLGNTFLMFVFGVALIGCTTVMLIKKQKIGKWELLFGALIGVPNYLSSKFMLIALNYIDAVIVFPTFSVGCIVVVTLVGVLAFKEKLSKRQLGALGMIMVALAMLNI